MRHVIPVNISSDGGVFGGMFKKKNCIEAGIYMFACFILLKFLFFLPMIPKLIIGGFLFIFPTFIILIGIGDQSVFEWIGIKIRYRRSTEIIPYLIQTENEEEIPRDLIGRHKWKKQKRKEAKEEKKKRKQHMKEYNEKNSAKKGKKSKKKKRPNSKKAEKARRKAEKKRTKKNKRKKKGKDLDDA